MTINFSTNAHPWRISLGFILSFSIVAACNGDADETDPSAGEVSPSQTSEDEQGFDPIDGMEVRSGQTQISPEDLVVVQLAGERLVAKCMAAAGFDYSANVEIAERYTVPRAPAFLSPDELRRSGYQFDWEGMADDYVFNNQGGGTPHPTELMSESELAAYVEALAGAPSAEQVTIGDEQESTSIPATGCLAEARRELYGSLANYMRFDNAVESISGTGLSRKLQTYPEYQAPLDEWHECMRDLGHDVADPDDYGLPYVASKTRTALSHGGVPPSPDETQIVANDDADCQESSGLHEVRESLRSQAESELATNLGFELSDYIALQHAVLDRAKRVP